MKLFIPLIVVSLLWIGCAGSKKMTKSVVKPITEDSLVVMDDTEIRNLDTMVVTPDDDEPEVVTDKDELPYRSTYDRRWDLLHTSLKLRFDWMQEHVMGQATIKAVPLFYTTDSIQLDAKTFDIHAVKAGAKVLNYSYDGKIITIRLGKPYTKKDTLYLSLDYTARPSENTTSGSAAITDDNGLYFIDPRNTDANLPTQIWTQGETENNSRWFPTVDKPNERMTTDITITVPDTMSSLSNGLLTKSVQNPDHTRTDTWEMDQPHAPYLVMLAIGPFAKVSDTWNNIPVDYYVDKPYAVHARAIYNHTPEMLSFFSNKLGIPYPWKKFSQVVVHKYVSGAMENTTAVVFGDFIQKTRRELIDDSNDKIVAHEMFHHWFGDYVTCESWSNLTLNEGFANYSEYLWFEHKYGKYEADRHREEELMGYLSSLSFGQSHNLIDYHYGDKENMFDAHSYNKGGLVLHMLRHYVGDEAFFAALNLYLRRHAYKSVEVHDLRLAFEETTGEDLNWFFNQWYLDDGQPTLEYSTTYDAAGKQLIIDINQTQKKSYPDPFILPIDIDIHHADQTITRHRIRMTERHQQFSFPLAQSPSLTILDPNRVLLAEWNEPELTKEEYQTQWKKCNNLELKLSALSALTEEKDYQGVWREAIQHPFWYIRLRAMDYPPSLSKEDLEKVKTMATNDVHSQVRAAAIRILSNKQDGSYESFYENIISKDSAYVVLSEALKALTTINPQKAASMARSLKDENNSVLQEGIAEVMGSEAGDGNLDYFEEKLQTSPQLAPALMDKYISLLTELSPDTQYEKAAFLFKEAIKPDLDKNSKFYFVRGIFELKEEILHAALNAKDAARLALEEKVKKIKSWLQEIREKETDVNLKGVLKGLN